jgi:hypothetical protein
MSLPHVIEFVILFPLFCLLIVQFQAFFKAELLRTVATLKKVILRRAREAERPREQEGQTYLALSSAIRSRD